MKRIFAVCMLLALLLGGCGKPAKEEPAPVVREDALYLGADISSLIALENSGMVYKNKEGEPQDLIQILHDAGLNAIRVRIWNDPYDKNGNGYGGGNCDLATAIAIGKRAAQYDMGLLVDLHYSDFWADPGKQQVPKAWEGLSFEEKKQAMQSYTRKVLETLADEQIPVEMVQIGNETTGGFCGEWTVEGQYTLMAAAAQTVRSFDPDIRIVVHYTNPEKGGYQTFAQRLQDYQVDYDIFASSYYPAWHGTPENLAAQLKSVREGFGKDVMVAETAWDNITYEANPATPYPYSVDGQIQAIQDVIRTVREVEGVGVFYWEPAWIELPGVSWEERSEIWEQYGTGWASSFAGEYDPDDAGKYYGGSACTKQALFDENGVALDSLFAFRSAD